MLLFRIQKLHVHIGSQPHVIRQVPAHMIGIVIDHNLVRVPQPTVAVTYIERRYAPVPVVEPEASRSAARQVPHMARAKPSRKVTMLERMVEMIVRIILACVVTDPFVPIHVGSIRMARLIAQVTRRCRQFRRTVKGGWPARRRSLMRISVVLGKYRHRKTSKAVNASAARILSSWDAFGRSS